MSLTDELADAADELCAAVKLFTSYKEGWETIEDRAELYRKMVNKLTEYEKLRKRRHP